MDARIPPPLHPDAHARRGPRAAQAVRPSRRLLLVAAAVAAALAACDRPATRPPAGSAGAEDEETPRQVVERLVAARRAGLYQPLRGLILPGQAHAVISTLVAVDEFLMANAALCAYVNEHFTLGLSQSIDQSRLARNLDIFSAYVDVLEEHIDGRHATVSFSVDGQIPLRHAALERIDGAWRYDPGAGYDPRLPAAFQQMARGLRQVLDDLKSGRLAADTISERPEELIEEVRLRLLPGIKLLPPPPATRPGGD